MFFVNENSKGMSKRKRMSRVPKARMRYPNLIIIVVFLDIRVIKMIKIFVANTAVNTVWKENLISKSIAPLHILLVFGK